MKPQQTQDKDKDNGRGTSEATAMSRRRDPDTMWSSHPFSVLRRLFDDSFGRASFVPSVEVMQHDDRLIVKADLPGMEPNDVRITADHGDLVIEGERRSEHEDNEGDVWRCERSYGRFERRIALPPGAEIESAEARFDNGVLEISMRAPSREQRRTIDIKTGSTKH